MLISKQVTSYAQMRQLLDWEGDFITEAKTSVTRLYSSWRKSAVLSSLEIIENDRGPVTSSTLEHPVAQFKLIRRFEKVWPEIDKFLGDEGRSVKGLKSIIEQLKQYREG